MRQIESLFASNVIKETFSPLLENVLMNDSGGGVGGETNDIMLCHRKVYKCRDEYWTGYAEGSRSRRRRRHSRIFVDKAVNEHSNEYAAEWQLCVQIIIGISNK